MSPTDDFSLPREVEKLLAAGAVEEAGEELRRHGEHLARSDPGSALPWARRLSERNWDDPMVAAYAGWTAGAVRHLTGDTGAAEPLLVSAARRMRRLGRPDLADRTGLLLIDVYGESLRLASARRLAGRLHRGFEARGDGERAAVALANLACAEDAADRVGRARDLWRRALRGLDPNTLRWLLVRANLANVAGLAGRFAEAEEGHREVARTARSLDLEALAQQAELNLAETEFTRGSVDAALARWVEVIDVARGTGNRVIELTAEIDLARAEAEFGQRQRARSRVERVLPEIRRAALVREEVRALRLLAVLDAADGPPGSWRPALQQLGGPELALQRDLLVVEVAQLDPTIEPAEVARSARRLLAAGLRHRGLVGLAWAARRAAERGDRRRSQRWSREVMSRRWASPWARMVAHAALGHLDGPASTRHLFAAVRLADRLHGRLVAAADRGAFLAMRGEVYVELISRLLDRGSAADRRRALDLASRFRSGWLADELTRRADRSDDAMVRRWQELRRSLAALLGEVEGEDEPRVRRSGLRLRTAVCEVEEELNDVEVALGRRLPVALGSRHRRSVAVRLLELLPEGHVFVEFFLGGRDLITFVVADGTLAARRHRGAAAELRRLASSLRFHLDAHSWVRNEQTRRMADAMRSKLRRLGDMLLCELPKSGWDTLWVVPQGELYTLPWAALEVADLGALLDRCRLTLAPSADAVVEVLSNPPLRPRSVAFGGAPAAGLPYVAREIEALGRLLPEAERRKTTSRDDLLRMLESHDVVHLAGHALFLDGLPAASGLRLSDGFLTVHDLAAARLQAQLVSFGVCSGVRVAGSESHRYEGFLRTLMAGGVRSVVGVVAPVKDEVAYRFDLAFHDRLWQCEDPGRAYVDAVQAVRSSDPHPAAWGNFHLYGDLRRWESA